LGSTFTLYLPLATGGAQAAFKPVAAEGAAAAFAPIRFGPAASPAFPDDRLEIEPDDQVLLIVEDDAHYARILADVARDAGYKYVVARSGAEAMSLIREHPPTAVSLDIFLPDMLGWTILSQLKQDPMTRHIPVQVVTLDDDRQHALARGAFSFLSKPATKEGLKSSLQQMRRLFEGGRKRLLIVEDNEAEQMSIRELLAHDDIEIAAVGSGSEALEWLQANTADCIVLDLRLPDISGLEVMERLFADDSVAATPVVVFSGRELSAEEDARIHSMARSVIVKGVESPERLLDETSLFLHRVIADLPVAKQKLLERLHQSDEDLVGKTALLVDDDARNIFALSSVLERRNMNVLSATTGGDALEIAEKNPDISIVLMDIMMPGMDGFETMQTIRQSPAFRRLPIIALTAKAMKGDREKCLEAGASDYLAKPVNTEQLLSVLRIWLHR
jgi:CheY-like chemotaxis protein